MINLTDAAIKIAEAAERIANVEAKKKPTNGFLLAWFYAAKSMQRFGNKIEKQCRPAILERIAANKTKTLRGSRFMAAESTSTREYVDMDYLRMLIAERIIPDRHAKKLFKKTVVRSIKVNLIE